MTLTLILLQFVHQLYHLLTHIGECLVVKRLEVRLRPREGLQAHHHLSHGNGDLRAALHAWIPREGAVAILQGLQLIGGNGQAVVDHVLVKEVGKALVLFTLTVGSSHPRGLGKQKVFQLLVL